MPETHQEVVKVWIAPGCIVCDACENDCPEVFDVQEATCIIRPPAQSADFLKPLTPSIIIAAEGCPVDVIKFETIEVEGKAPWPSAEEQAAAAAAAGGETSARAPAAKVAAPMAPADPKWQALLSTSRISPSMSAGLATTVRKSAEVVQAQEIVQQAKLPKDAPADQRAALLAVGGAYAPQPSLADRIRSAASGAAKVSRRHFNLALVIGWGAVAAVTATFGAMFQDFFGPKVLKEPKKVYRIGKPEDFGNANSVFEQFKPAPWGFWIVNLQPSENKLVAISTICTHLGCIPNWLSSDNKFKCPCHGSGYYMTGVNFEGPTPRPLERFAISKDPDGYIVVDKGKVFRQELGEWDSPECFVNLA
ncbi:MAG TPA: Rieske 2Fe-2S domain-containing protein [Tepidisphaeraceae bacterium]|jgi:cytochrome b6-f complex iron-sulfur subunit